MTCRGHSTMTLDVFKANSELINEYPPMLVDSVSEPEHTVF